MKKSNNKVSNPGRKTIAVNKRARFEYHIEERFEAGIALEGWEVKALRDGRIQFADSYVLLKDNEAFLFGCLINPLPTASTHISPDPTRTRKLLLHRGELDRPRHLRPCVRHEGRRAGRRADVRRIGPAPTGAPNELRT